MANTVKIKQSAVPAKVPTIGQLSLGELAVNTYDGKLYIKRDNGTQTVIEIGAPAYTISSSPPSSPSVGHRWLYTVNGRTYTWIDDGTSSQWVELDAAVLTDLGFLGPLDGGNASTIGVLTVDCGGAVVTDDPITDYYIDGGGA